jgi:uncharacterized membrane-anchored protein YjiN (DUF445 family)
MTGSISVPAVDVQRAAELRRIKLLATLTLVVTFAVFIAARAMLPLHPAMGFIAAFAEAATIGGLADWYAVVALFRHPLGLPIPHTAIIQGNQARIADKLGEFIETNFLAAGPVEAKLREVDFASFVADWLCDSKRSNDLARFVLRLLPEAMSAIEQSGLKSFALRRVMAQADAIDLAPLASATLSNWVASGKHRGLLDELMRALHDTLGKPDTLQTIRDKVRDELPTLLRLYRADRFIVNKLVKSVLGFFEQVRADPEHPFRGEFDRMIQTFIAQLGSDPAYAERLQSLKRDLLARPELAKLIRAIWDNARGYIETSAAEAGSPLQRQLAAMLASAGSSLAGDLELRQEINSGIVAVARSFIAEQKSGVSSFIADQVKGWDMRQLIGVIELNVGRDLQYIRFNGTLIGGLAGLALHTAEVLLRLP